MSTRSLVADPYAHWTRRGNCADEDPEAMYPEEIRSELLKSAAVGYAKRVCAGCPVARQCLTEAVQLRDEFGVRAGLTGDFRMRHRQMSVDDMLEESERQVGWPTVVGTARDSNRVAGPNKPSAFHDTVIGMLSRVPRSTYWQVARQIGSTEAAVKTYWHRYLREKP